MTSDGKGIASELSKHSDILIAVFIGLAVSAAIVIYILNIPGNTAPQSAEKPPQPVQAGNLSNDSLALENGARLIRIVENNTYSVDIEYTSDGRKYRYIFFPELIETLEWLRNNTLPGDVVTSWWDYGHTIRGYSDRKALAYAPSKSILFSVAEYSRTGKWDSVAAGDLEEDSRISDLAAIFSTSDYPKARQIMQKYGSRYVLVGAFDVSRTWVMYNVTNTPHEIVNTGIGPIAINSTSLIFQILNLSKIDGFELAFTDNRSAAIYRVK
ncbi:MAG: hypothetical protein HYX24_01125 [Candidatus Aenigmarchaeota archaeon]|nr:hypothetical protein [Candidatus Aenigmarchaeota archaeon]